MRVFFAWHAAVEREYRKLFAALADLGVTLVVVAPTAWTEGGRLQRISLAEGERGYTLIPLPVLFRDRLKGFCYFNVITIARALRFCAPQVVHIFEEPYSAVCFELVLLAKIFAPDAGVVIQSFENLPLRQRPPFSWFESFSLAKADGLIVVPREGLEVWRGKGYKGPVAHLPVGIDERIFTRRDAVHPVISKVKSSKVLTIGYVGRLVPEKGIETLLQACSRLMQEGIGHVLYIVGTGPYESHLRQAARQLGIAELVCFLGLVKAEQLPSVYSGLDVLVLPSRTTARWKEQFGRVLVEAMACGVAVVGSTSGEIPNVVGDAGLIFSEGDVADLTRALRELAVKPELRLSLAAAARRRVLDNYTWTAVAAKTLQFYEEVLSSAKKPA